VPVHPDKGPARYHGRIHRLGLALLLLPAALRADEEPYRFEDALWNVAYAAPGLRKLIAPSDPNALFKGRAQGGVTVEITVHEPKEGKADAAALRDALRERRKLKDATQGDEPRPWLSYSVTKHRVFEEVHGHAFYARGPHCFEVHAWLTDRTPSAEKDIRTALDALSVGEDPGCGVMVVRVAQRHGRRPLDPEVLIEAGRQYLADRPDLAAAVLRRARAVATEPDALKPEDREMLLLLGGRALLATGAAEEAALWLREAEQAATPEKAEEVAYELARACAVAGLLDDAFAALDRAFANELVVSKARLSKEKDLEPLRRDPRWEDFWRRNVEGR